MHTFGLIKKKKRDVILKFCKVILNNIPARRFDFNERRAKSDKYPKYFAENRLNIL